MTRTLDAPTTTAGPWTRTPDALRRRLPDLHGTVLEIGPGGGTNLPLYAPDVHWIGVEPDRAGREAATGLADRLGRSAQLVGGRAEDLDVLPGSIDAVVGTYVLCSVEDPRRAVAEVRRVLRPGGLYLFAEHVAASRGTWTRRAMTDTRRRAALIKDSPNRTNPAPKWALDQRGTGAGTPHT